MGRSKCDSLFVVSVRNNILWPFELPKMKSLRYAIILFLYWKLIAECITVVSFIQ